MPSVIIFSFFFQIVSTIQLPCSLPYFFVAISNVDISLWSQYLKKKRNVSFISLFIFPASLLPLSDSFQALSVHLPGYFLLFFFLLSLFFLYLLLLMFPLDSSAPPHLLPLRFCKSSPLLNVWCNPSLLSSSHNGLILYEIDAFISWTKTSIPQVSGVSEWANEWVQLSTPAKRKVQKEQCKASNTKQAVGSKQ